MAVKLVLTLAKCVPLLRLVSRAVLYFTVLQSIMYAMLHVGMRTRANSSATRSHHSNGASERCVERVRAKASETLRYTLFSIRCEMLLAASKMSQVIAVMSCSQKEEDDFNFHQSHHRIGRTLQSGKIRLN